MSLINFLSESYLQQASRHRRRCRHLSLNAIVLVCLVGWGLVERGENVTLKQRSEDMKAEEATARSQMNEIIKIRSEHADLKHRFKVQHELHQPISHTQILATFSELLPLSVSLTELHVITKRPPPQPLENVSKKNRHNRKKTSKDQTPDRIDDQVEIELDGLAPDDLTIAQLIGDLSDHPLFDQVAMQYARPVDMRDINGRQFRLSMRVRLDRRFKVQEMAHAD